MLLGVSGASQTEVIRADFVLCVLGLLWRFSEVASSSLSLSLCVGMKERFLIIFPEPRYNTSPARLYVDAAISPRSLGEEESKGDKEKKG